MDESPNGPCRLPPQPKKLFNQGTSSSEQYDMSASTTNDMYGNQALLKVFNRNDDEIDEDSS